MRAKEYLSQLKGINHQIKHRIELISETDDSEVREKLIAEKEELILKKDKIIREIESISEVSLKYDYSELLYKIYVEEKRKHEIAKELCYSYDWIRHMHRIALDLFEKTVLEGKSTHKNT